MKPFQRYKERIRKYIHGTSPKGAVSFTDERVSHLFTSLEDQDLLAELIALYEQLEDDKVIAAEEIRQAFLLGVRNSPPSTLEAELIEFLTGHVGPEDYAKINWETPEQVVAFCEVLYSSRFDSDAFADQAITHVRHLLRTALQHFEREGQMEKMFQLLRLAPIPPMDNDAELLRLRNRAYLYEMHRVRRLRRILYTYLLVQVALVVVIFPILFIQSENCNIQETVEETANVNIPEEVCRQNIGYPDALYWAIITASSIGYGDLTPLTGVGKAMAATLGTMGVITVGMIAGLVLNWVRPRRFD